MAENTNALTFERTEDFISEYANSARFESTVYDLKIIFGQTDLASGQEIVRQHTAITIPWALVKIAKYYLEVNLLAHEAANGTVLVPPSQFPAPIAEPEAEMLSSPPTMTAYDMIKKLREEFIKANT